MRTTKYFVQNVPKIFLSFCDLCWSVPQCYCLTRDQVANSLSVQRIHLIYQNKALYVDCITVLVARACAELVVTIATETAPIVYNFLD